MRKLGYFINDVLIPLVAVVDVLCCAVGLWYGTKVLLGPQHTLDDERRAVAYTMASMFFGPFVLALALPRLLRCAA